MAGILAEIRQALSEDHLLLLSGNNSQSRYLKENSLHYHVGYSLAQNQKLYENNITGLICVNDMLAYGVMDALAEKGYRIPEDVSVVGFDNFLYPGLCDIGITTYEVDISEMARRAIHKIVRKIANENYTAGVFIVDGHVVFKDSVARI